MENRAARTAWGPIIQVVLEQLVPGEQRVVHDAVAYRFLPAYLKGLVNLFRVDFLRQVLISFMDRRVPGIRGGLLCRKRYIDEKLKEVLTGGVQSVVILGAGFDTRAYRLPEAASLQVYEVDLPQNIQLKTEILQRLFGRVPVHVKLVPLDFDSQDLAGALQQAGFSMDQPSFFIWEGVTQYISETAVCKVFEFLRSTPVCSRLVFSYIRKDFIEGKRLYGLDVLYRQTRVDKQLFQFGMDPDSVGAFLGEYAWSELEQAGSADYEARYLKPVNRVMQVMEVERMVYAERMEN